LHGGHIRALGGPNKDINRVVRDFLETTAMDNLTTSTPTNREIAMIVARWSIDARFGHKAVVVDSMKRWLVEVGSQIGWTAENTRLLTGSIGTHESTVQSEVVLKDIAELNGCWDKLAAIEAHKQWSMDLEPYVVSGSPRWEVLRIL
jgi:hypothetical protein